MTAFSQATFVHEGLQDDPATEDEAMCPRAGKSIRLHASTLSQFPIISGAGFNM